MTNACETCVESRVRGPSVGLSVGRAVLSIACALLVRACARRASPP